MSSGCCRTGRGTTTWRFASTEDCVGVWLSLGDDMVFWSVAWIRTISDMRCCCDLFWNFKSAAVIVSCCFFGWLRLSELFSHSPHILVVVLLHCRRRWCNDTISKDLKSCQDDARMGEIDNWTLVRVSTVWKSIKLLDINSWDVSAWISKWLRRSAVIDDYQRECNRLNCTFLV